MEIPYGKAMMLAVLSTLNGLSHTTSELGIWTGGAFFGARLMLSYVLDGCEIPKADEVNKTFMELPERESFAAIIKTMHDRFENWKREQTRQQVEMGPEFFKYETFLEQTLSVLDNLPSKK
jgi:hypothetical protein